MECDYESKNQRQKAFAGERWKSRAQKTARAIIPAAVLADEPLTIRNIPDIQGCPHPDCNLAGNRLFGLFQRQHPSALNSLTKIDPDIGSEEVKKLRGSYYFMGAFPGKTEESENLRVRGCNLGHRPINSISTVSGNSEQMLRSKGSGLRSAPRN